MKLLTTDGRQAGQIFFLLQFSSESSSSLSTEISFSKRATPTGWPSLSPRNGWWALNLEYFVVDGKSIY